MRTIQTIVEFKNGEITIATTKNGAIEVVKPTNRLFKVGDTKSSLPNAVCVIDALLTELAKYNSENKTNMNKHIIAVPSSLHTLLNNNEMLIQMLWTKKLSFKLASTQDSKVALVFEKNDKRRNLTDAEYNMYSHLVYSMRLTLDAFMIKDSQFVPFNHKEGETESDATWCELKKALYDTRKTTKAPEANTNYTPAEINI